MNDDVNEHEDRWSRGIVITPFKVWGFPARTPLTFADKVWSAVERLKQRMLESEYAHPEKFDGGYPKLLIDHWGFSLDLKRHSRKIADYDRASVLFSGDDIDSLKLIVASIPPPKRRR